MKKIRYNYIKNSDKEFALIKEKVYREILFNKNIFFRDIILYLFNHGALDKHIWYLQDVPIKIFKNRNTKDNYISSIKNYLYVVDNFIDFILNNYTLGSNYKEIIANCILCDNNKAFLLRDYYYNSSYTDYYMLNFKLITIYNFINNAIILEKDIKDELKNIGINLKRVNLNNKEDINMVFELLNELTFINKSKYGLIAFYSKLDLKIYENYALQYSMLINNYLRHIDLASAYATYNREYNI